VSLAPPDQVGKLQAALHTKAKSSPDYRFYALYDKLYRRDVLDYAYRRCRTNDGAPGVDRQAFRDIEEYGTDRWLDELAEELRRGTYRPQPVRRVYIPKPDGKQRPLGIPICRSYCTSSQGGWGFRGPESDPRGSRSLKSRDVATNGAAPAGATPRSPRVSVGSTGGRVAPLECYPAAPLGTRRRSSRYSHSIVWPLPGPNTARPHDSHLDRQPAHQGSRS